SIRKSIKDSGLLSRFIPFSYKYPINKVSEIFKTLENETNDKSVEVPKINKEYKEVYGSPELFSQLEIVSTELGRQYGAYGFRAQKSLQRLAKANALMDNRTIVIQKDIDKILHLGNWINLEFNVI
ncbi:MAG: hypothetical protein J7L15_08855, partial [Clostridiales bacterium]|nr:hypothetical protein [Clostridiales bacterium]